VRRLCRSLISVMLVHVLLFAFTGCVRPPNTERSAAKGSMDAAISAGADTYAAADFRLAQGFWHTAESRMADRKYKEARRYYINAKSSFEKAVASVAAGKRAAADAAKAALPGLENDAKSLEIAAAKATKQKKTYWAPDEKHIVEGLRAANDMIANDPAGALTKMREIRTMIDSWNAVFKGTAPAPTKSYAPGKG
jgi:hypothetical protein